MRVGQREGRVNKRFLVAPAGEVPLVAFLLDLNREKQQRPMNRRAVHKLPPHKWPTHV